MSARDRILDRVRSALRGRASVEHPGDFASWKPHTPDHRPEPAEADPVDELQAVLGAAGGEVLRHPTVAAAASWLADFAAAYEAVTVGETVPAELRPALPEGPAESTPLGVSMARGAIAETGSLLLDARDGRRSQLLAPSHVVFVRASDVHATFRGALLSVRVDLPSAIGLHSGPSKSADIGHVMVKGVHGPGRLIAVVIGAGSEG